MFFLIPSLHSRIIVVYGGVLAAIICVPTACARRPRGALGDLTALWLHCRCEPTPFTRCSFRSPWERRATAHTLCMHKVRAVAWRPRPHGVQRRCHSDAAAIPRHSRRSHCAHLGVLSFSCTPCSRREDTTLVWQGLKFWGSPIVADFHKNCISKQIVFFKHVKEFTQALYTIEHKI